LPRRSRGVAVALYLNHRLRSQVIHDLNAVRRLPAVRSRRGCSARCDCQCVPAAREAALVGSLKEIQQQCQRKGLRAPNFRTVKRHVDAFDAKEQVRKRAGAKAASDRFRPTRVLSTTDLLPLERVQIDHTKVDVIVVDEGDRLPIGRPWLTLAIDVASRVVLGFSVALEGPSAVSVALTLVQAVLPKDLWLADRQLEVPWPMWGLPELPQLDNAPEFHSRALVRGAQEYIRTDYRRPARRTSVDTLRD
jgi:putative transposase